MSDTATKIISSLDEIKATLGQTLGEVINMGSAIELLKEVQAKEQELQQLRSSKDHEFSLAEIKNNHEIKLKEIETQQIKTRGWIKVASIIAGGLLGSSGILYLLLTK